MDGRTGSITVTALVGTGLATLALSLTGVAGLSGDLQAAAIKTQQTTPLLTPNEELRDTQRHRALILREACLKRKLEHGHGGASSGTLSTTPTVPSTTPSTTREF